jgi:hypothetical protein
VLGTLAASGNARLSKSAFVAGALLELGCGRCASASVAPGNPSVLCTAALCKGNARMYHASMFSLARTAVRQCVPGCDVLVAEVGEVYFASVLLAMLLFCCYLGSSVRSVLCAGLPDPYTSYGHLTSLLRAQQ